MCIERTEMNYEIDRGGGEKEVERYRDRTRRRELGNEREREG